MEQLPVWLNQGIEPPENLKVNGWAAGVKPPAQYFNYLQYRAYKCLEELQQITGELESLNVTNASNLVGAINKVNTSLTTHLDENVHIGKNEKVILSRTNEQSILNGEFIKATFDTVSNSFTSVANSTVTISVEGFYDVSFSAYFVNNTNAIGNRSIYIYKNDAIVAQVTSAYIQSLGVGLNTSKLLNLKVGDKIEFKLFQTSGNALSVGQLEASIVRVA